MQEVLGILTGTHFMNWFASASESFNESGNDETIFEFYLDEAKNNWPGLNWEVEHDKIDDRLEVSVAVDPYIQCVATLLRHPYEQGANGMTTIEVKTVIQFKED